MEKCDFLWKIWRQGRYIIAIDETETDGPDSIKALDFKYRRGERKRDREIDNAEHRMRIEVIWSHSKLLRADRAHRVSRIYRFILFHK